MKNTSKVLIALGAGLAIGGVLGVLFAPDKGTVTRHKISDNGKKLKDQFNRKVKFGTKKQKTS
ncbi:MAG: YtxH domain-containing protein [Chitinophagaceae bacterium]|nr:YtxH domain-containing protein [Chitinophagaceae bacterium]